jgi:tRNA pseudouridine synthase 10
MQKDYIINNLLKSTPLCDTCLGRQFQSSKKEFDYSLTGKEIRMKFGFPNNLDGPCYICGNLMNSMEKYVMLVTNALNEYEHESVLIGSRISSTIIEKEDYLRSELKLRGGETFKANFTRILNHIISDKSRVTIKHRKPDVTVILDTLQDKVEVVPKSIKIYGRYVKKERGLSQKIRLCSYCRGLGCIECRSSDAPNKKSVEQYLSENVSSLFRAHKMKFTWIGSEDSESLVLGNGRPFYAEIFDPKIRTPKINSERIKLTDRLFVKGMKIVDKIPQIHRAFIITIISNIKLDKTISPKDVKNLEETFKSVIVEFKPPNKKHIIKKKIYDFAVESIHKYSLKIRIECDGGLSIRQLFTNSVEVNPNLSRLLNRRVTLDDKRPFDILNVKYPV